MSTATDKDITSACSKDCCATDEVPLVKPVATEHNHQHVFDFKGVVSILFSSVMLLLGVLLSTYPWFSHPVNLIFYVIAYLPVAYPVLKKGLELALKGDLFTEFFLMGIATIGAFFVGEYSEGVAVMLFYTVGELFQEAAVKRARNNVKALLDLRPASATVRRDGSWQRENPENVKPGDLMQVLAGERVALDGRLDKGSAYFNTSALTGESVPELKIEGEEVLAGMINTGEVVEIKITKKFSDSAVTRMLQLVQEAASRKAQTELLIRKLARIYTPAVVVLALALTFLPYFFTPYYVFNDWLYRALVFLVISCPCALVISIPLGYFGGIGAASAHGILFKGGNFLDAITKVQTVVFDKTGTLTKGVFKVVKMEASGISDEELIAVSASLERNSTHPAAKAIIDYAKKQMSHGSLKEAESVKEVPGKGLVGMVGGRKVVAGKLSFLVEKGVQLPHIENMQGSIVAISIDGTYRGCFTIDDELRDESANALEKLKRAGVKQFAILSGDRMEAVEKVAASLGIATYHHSLLPQDKLQALGRIKESSAGGVAFVGDGINDAPVLALSDVGIAMGGMGSDAAIEAADVVVQTDKLTKVATAIQIGNATREVVWQNITLALGVKLAVLLLSAFGMATMWGAVFADVGVALLAILNAVRIQRMSFN